MLPGGSLLDKFDGYYAAQFAGIDLIPLALVDPEWIWIEACDSSLNIRPYAAFDLVAVNEHSALTAAIAHMVKIVISHRPPPKQLV